MLTAFSSATRVEGFFWGFFCVGLFVLHYRVVELLLLSFKLRDISNRLLNSTTQGDHISWFRGFSGDLDNA